MQNKIRNKAFLNTLEYQVLPYVQKPERYTGGEGGTILKDDFDLHFCLVFADTYEIAMSNIGIQLLYNTINERIDTLAELCFCPWPDMEKKMKSEGIQLYSHGTYTPLKNFDIIGISSPHEMCYTNILTILSLAGIPINASKRSPDKYPLIIGGGALSYNPSPIEDFFDMIVIGEGEEVINVLLDKYKTIKKTTSRNDFLNEFKDISGIYLPGSKKNTSRVYTSTIKKPDHPFPVISNVPPVHDRSVVEIARGCPWGCRYCQAGYAYRPYREKNWNDAVDEAFASLEYRGDSEISFLSLSSSDYKDLSKIIENLKKDENSDHVSLNFPSMRITRSTLKILESVYTKKKPTITLAPEAGTERMINIIGKKLVFSDFYEIAGDLYKTGWQNIKLYFMIGLPFETEKDLTGIIDVIQNISSARKKVDGKMARINVTISNFIPKPQTPFQWSAQSSIEEILKKQQFIKRNIKNRFVTLKFTHPSQSFVEGILARGDQKTALLVKKAWELGARFDNWSETFNINIWNEAINSLSLELNDYFSEKKTEDILPWDNIQTFTSKKHLLKEWESAKQYANNS
ncbi:MAG: radical SAM protein [Candidatus Aureabacteria bacterium]|nr:radical SAM protein [Candidatus Auribacterota bacterium]